MPSESRRCGSACEPDSGPPLKRNPPLLDFRILFECIPLPYLKTYWTKVSRIPVNECGR